jgi:mono/diheme cytochrome c family protein
MKNRILAVAWFAAICFGLVVNGCDENPYPQGKVLYENFCANCHMEDGTGLKTLIPPLAGADFLAKHQEKLPCIIRKGMKGEIVVNDETYNNEMPGSPALTEFEITNVINYINHAWGNDYGVVKHLSVREALEECP